MKDAVLDPQTIALDAHPDAGRMDFGFTGRPAPIGESPKVAVIGAGPAGLAAAGRLAALGFHVTVFDKLAKAGGLMVYGIPGHRIPTARIEAGAERLRTDFEVDFRFRTIICGADAVNRDAGDAMSVEFKSLGGRILDHDAVLICTGSWRSRRLNIPGEDLPGVSSGLHFLFPFRAADQGDSGYDCPDLTGKRVAVIGAGLTAVDAVQAALARGAEVFVFYRRTKADAPCGEFEIDEMLEAGAEFLERAAPKRILGDGKVEAIEAVVNGELKTFPVDQVVTAIGELPTPPFAKELGLGALRESSRRGVFETNFPGVFVAGDALSGPSKVGRAVFSGLRAADSVAAWLADWNKRPDKLETEKRPTVVCIDPKKTIHIDYAKCIGCETCQTVCGYTHGGHPRIHMTRTREGISIPVHCRHCEHPTCVKACSRGALSKGPDGAVTLDAEACRGCLDKHCVQACPYHAVFCAGGDEPVLKCDFCAERRGRGLLPACVAMCPAGALSYIDREAAHKMPPDSGHAAVKRILKHLRPKAEAAPPQPPTDALKP